LKIIVEVMVSDGSMKPILDLNLEETPNWDIVVDLLKELFDVEQRIKAILKFQG
jgi:predicted DNA-binding antitoxin AbrB/MazE fold protein